MAKRTVGNNKIDLTGTTFKLPETTIVKFGANTLSTILGDKANVASPTFTNNVGIGTNTPRAVLDIVSTSAILVPAGTTGQQPTGIKGMLRYNTGTNIFEGFSGTWSSLGTTVVTPVGITGVAATADSWVVTTDNASGVFGVLVTLADAPVVYSATLNPFLTDNGTIATNSSAVWPTTVWLASASGVRANRSGQQPWKAFNGLGSVTDGMWESNDAFNTASGGGGLYTGRVCWIQLKYPLRYIMSSFIVTYAGGQKLGAATWWIIQGSNDNITFDDIQEYQYTRSNAGVDSYIGTILYITTEHIPYMYWRMNIKQSLGSYGGGGAVEQTMISVGLDFYTIASNVKVGNAFKSSINQFTIDMVDYAGYPVNIASGASQKFNILLTKDGQIVNAGLYTFTAPNTYSKAT